MTTRLATNLTRGRQGAPALAALALTVACAGMASALSTYQPTVDSHRPTASAQVVSGTHTQGRASTSPNWAGEAMKSKTRGTFQGVSAYWYVPRVKATARSKYSCTWVGVDGATNSSLIQTGTESDSINGHTRYYAWWEILPASQKVIRYSNGNPVPVRPGDKMWGFVVKTATPGVWRIYLQDITRGWTLDITRNYSGPGQSAEWIEEATQIGGKISPMPRFSPVTFTGLEVAEAGTWYSTALGASNGIKLVQHGQLRAYPASVTATNPQSFSVYHP
jgi:hypothetical protein